MVGLAGSNPVPYLAVNWGLHGLNVALVFLLVRRMGGGIMAASLAAGLFGTSRLYYSALAQAVGVGDHMALCLTLVACTALTFTGRWAMLCAVLSFAAALLSKESVLLIPLSFLLLNHPGVSWRDRIRRVGLVALIGVAWMLYLVATTRSTIFGGRAYERGLGSNLIEALVTYGQWSVDLVGATPDLPPGGLSAVGVGVWTALVLGVTFTATRTRRWLPLVGLAWWLLGVAPVLPLLHQRNAYYLLAPLVGLGIAIGAALEVALGKLPRKAAATSAAITVVALLGHAYVNDRLLERRIREPLYEGVDMARDPFIRKVKIVRRVSESVGSEYGSRPARLVIVTPPIEGTSGFFTNLLPSIFDNGRGLRALHPNLDSVAFVSRWTPAYQSFDLIAGSVDGNVIFFGSSPEGHLRFIRTLESNGFPREAAAHRSAVTEAFPGFEGFSGPPP